MNHRKRAKLSPGQAGEDRCFELALPTHSNIIISTWRGDLGQEFATGDSCVNRFYFKHGSEVKILASFVGYYSRLGVGEAEKSAVFRQAAEDVLTEGSSVRGANVDSLFLSITAEGQPRPSKYNVPNRNLSCLHPQIAAHPGRLEDIGGTGIYARPLEAGKKALIFAAHEPTTAPDEKTETEITRTAEFYKPDIPKMAKAICDLSKGDYREEIRAFIEDSFPEE